MITLRILNHFTERWRTNTAHTCWFPQFDTLLCFVFISLFFQLSFICFGLSIVAKQILFKIR